MPDGILKEYVEKLDGAVDAIYSEPDLCDEFIEYQNDDVDERSARERWGEHYDDVWMRSVLRKNIFEEPE